MKSVYLLRIPNRWDNQGNVVDSIEHHIMQTVDYINSTNQKLREARKWKDRHRKVNSGAFSYSNAKGPHFRRSFSALAC